MSVTVALGGIWHETNTFASGLTDLDAFRAYQFTRGEDLLTRHQNVRNEIGGMIAGARACDLRLVPTLFAGAVPSGVVARDAFEQLAGWLVEDLAAQSNLDGVLLVLHGAMVVEDIPDAEAELLKRVRAVIGDKPLVATFDIHANLSAGMVEGRGDGFARNTGGGARLGRWRANPSVLIGYDTYPHVDIYERGVEAAQIMARILRGEIQPAIAFEHLPLMSVPQAQHTSQPPMREIMVRRTEIENDPRVVSASIAVGFPYSDVARAGMSVVITTNHDQGLAEAYARELREMIWARRQDFVIKNMSVSDAVRRALESTAQPVILVDVADNIGGGSPGDGTALLGALLAAHAQDAVVTIADAEAVAECIAGGIDQMVTVRVGCKVDRLHGSTIQVTGRVRLISSGEYVHKGSYMTGQTMRMGRTVVLDCNGVDMVLMERKTMPFDAQQLRSLGIEPADKKIIVVKSAIAWQAAYGDLVREVIYVDTPGICTANLKSLSYKEVRHPIFPLDEC